MDALEQEVRLLTSRLAGWVETQLVQGLDDRRQEMKALRAELLVQVDERLAAAQGAPAAGEALEQRVRAAMSRLSDSVEARLGQEVENRRAELVALRSSLEAAVQAKASKDEATVAATLSAVQDVAGTSATLGARLDEVAGQAAAAVKASAAFRAEADALPERIEAFEQRVKAAMGRLTDSVETRLVETAAGSKPAMDQLRSAVRATGARIDGLDQQVQDVRSTLADDRRALTDRLDAMAARVSAAAEGMAALQTEIDAGPARAELLEQRVKSAVGRLAETMESRLAEAGTATAAELTALRADLELAVSREATELRTALDTAVAALRARSGQLQERLDSMAQLHADVGGLRRELEDALAEQLRQARSEIGAVVSDAHRRFAVSVERLEEQMHQATTQAAAAQGAVARVEVLAQAVASDGRRLEALEEHTRRTDAHLGHLVDAKLTELDVQRLAEVRRAGEELRGVLDAGLAEMRAEVAASLAEGRMETAARTKRLDERVAALEALGRSIDQAQRDAEERIEQALQARLAALDAAAADVAAGRHDAAKAIASLERRTAQVGERMEHRVDALSQQVDALVRAASTEGGALAPLRSDVRLLQSQVAELAETLAQLRPRGKAAAKKAAAPAKRAAAPAKAAARRRLQ